MWDYLAQVSLQRSQSLACEATMKLQNRPRPGKDRGEGLYQVNPEVTSYHNLRAAPSLFSPIVGNLEAYDVLEVAQTIQLRGGDGSPETWAQLLRTSAGPAMWTLLSDGDHVYLRKLLRPGDAVEAPKAWTPASEADPYGEAAQSVNFVLAASLGSSNPSTKKTFDAVARHELELGRESGAVKQLEVEATKLRTEAMGYEQDLRERQGKRAETLRHFQRLKQREAWNVACAQIERQAAQVEELLEDTVDDAQALLDAQLLQRSKHHATEEATRRKKVVGRLGRQLMAEPPEANLDSQLIEVMTSLDTMLGQRYLEHGASSSTERDPWNRVLGKMCRPIILHLAGMCWTSVWIE